MRGHDGASGRALSRARSAHKPLLRSGSINRFGEGGTRERYLNGCLPAGSPARQGSSNQPPREGVSETWLYWELVVEEKDTLPLRVKAVRPAGSCLNVKLTM